MSAEVRFNDHAARRSAGLVLVVGVWNSTSMAQEQALTNPAAQSTVVTPPATPPLNQQAKSKVGLLAGGGLVVLALLVLACGLALLRAFKQH